MSKMVQKLKNLKESQKITLKKKWKKIKIAEKREKNAIFLVFQY